MESLVERLFRVEKTRRQLSAMHLGRGNEDEAKKELDAIPLVERQIILNRNEHSLSMQNAITAAKKGESYFAPITRKLTDGYRGLRGLFKPRAQMDERVECLVDRDAYFASQLMDVKPRRGLRRLLPSSPVMQGVYTAAATFGLSTFATYLACLGDGKEYTGTYPLVSAGIGLVVGTIATALQKYKRNLAIDVLVSDAEVLDAYLAKHFKSK